jgi:hypothetical protein
LTLDEFEKFVSECGMVNDLFVARDVAVCFVMAVQTQVNEITNDKHL